MFEDYNPLLEWTQFLHLADGVIAGAAFTTDDVSGRPWRRYGTSQNTHKSLCHYIPAGDPLWQEVAAHRLEDTQHLHSNIS